MTNDSSLVPYLALHNGEEKTEKSRHRRCLASARRFSFSSDERGLHSELDGEGGVECRVGSSLLFVELPSGLSCVFFFFLERLKSLPNETEKGEEED